MTSNTSQTVKPAVGGCYRLKLARHSNVTGHLVLVVASEGEWCSILDLQAHGQPNPAAGERLRWTNPHIQLVPIPHTQWPLVIRRLQLPAELSSRPSCKGVSAGRRAGHSSAQRAVSAPRPPPSATLGAGVVVLVA